MKSSIPLELIDIEGEGFHLGFLIQIQDIEARVILDTGASRTVIDSNCLNSYFENPELIEEERQSTGVGSSELKSYSFCVPKLRIGEIEICNYNAAILDLQNVTSSYEKIGLGKVHAVIGGDLLKKYKAVIDYDRLIMTLTME